MKFLYNLFSIGAATLLSQTESISAHYLNTDVSELSDMPRVQAEPVSSWYSKMTPADFMKHLETNKDLNKKPVIGILSQTLEDSMLSDPRYEGKISYIAANYVKWIESAGARVVPITSEESNESVIYKLQKLDGVVLPGGGGDYNKTAEFIFN